MDALLEVYGFGLTGTVTQPDGRIETISPWSTGYFTPVKVILSGHNKDGKPMYDCFSHGRRPMLMRRSAMFGAGFELREV